MRSDDFTKIHGDAAIEKAQLGTDLQRPASNVVLRLWGVLALSGVIAAFVLSDGNVPPTWLMVTVQLIVGLATLGVALAMKRHTHRKLTAERAAIKEIDDTENERKMNEFVQSQKEPDPRDTN